MNENVRAHSARRSRGVGCVSCLSVAIAVFSNGRPASAAIADILIADGADQATIACDGQNRVIAAWSEFPSIATTFIDNVIVQRFNANLSTNGASAAVSVSGLVTTIAYSHASIAMSFGASGDAAVGLAFNGSRGFNPTTPTSYFDEFGYNSFDYSTQGPPAANSGPGDDFPSAGVRSSGSGAFAWTSRTGATGDGILFTIPHVTTQLIRPCVPDDSNCFPALWQPCVAQRGDGYFVVVWAQEEDLLGSASDVVLQTFGASGELIGDAIVVNDASTNEEAPTPEASPAVSVEGDEMVVVWTGAEPGECGDATRIYARRLRFNPTGAPTLKEQFIVDSDPAWKVETSVNANPTVSLLKTDGSDDGRFLVCWNAVTTDLQAPIVYGIRGQFYERDGRRRGREMRMTAQTDYSTSGIGLRPELAQSAQHTVAYRPDGSVVLAWRLKAVPGFTENQVYFSHVPAADTANLYSRGDCNTDGRVDGDDIPPFVNALITQSIPFSGSLCPTPGLNPTAPALCPFDINADGSLSTSDVGPFACTLLYGEACVGCDGIIGSAPLFPLAGGEGGGQQMAMGGGGESIMGGESEGSPWQPWFTWEQVRDFAQWLKANPRSAHSELTDVQYYHLFRQAMKDNGLWRE